MDIRSDSYDDGIVKMSNLIIDVYDEHRLNLKRKYIKEGMSEEDADKKATNEVIQQIREWKPIKGIS